MEFIKDFVPLFDAGLLLGGGYIGQYLSKVLQPMMREMNVEINNFLVNQIRGYYLNWTLIHTTRSRGVQWVAKRISRQQSSASVWLQ